MLRTGDLISKFHICCSLVDRMASVGGSVFWTIGMSLLYRSPFPDLWWFSTAEANTLRRERPLPSPLGLLPAREEWELKPQQCLWSVNGNWKLEVWHYYVQCRHLGRSVGTWMQVQAVTQEGCGWRLSPERHSTKTAFKIQMEGVLLRSCFHSMCQERLGKESTEKKGFSGSLGDWWALHALNRLCLAQPFRHNPCS